MSECCLTIKKLAIIQIYQEQVTFEMRWLVSWFMMFNATFKNISDISWLPFLLVKETGSSSRKKNNRPAVSHWQIYHIMLHRVHLAWARFELTTLVVIGTDCIGSCKSNYHEITTTTTPLFGKLNTIIQRLENIF